MQALKRVEDADEVPATVTLVAVPVKCLVVVPRVDLVSIWQDYDDNRRQEGDSSKAEHVEASNGVCHHALFEKYFLWTEAGDSGGASEEALLATGSLVLVIGFEVPVSKKGTYSLYGLSLLRCSQGAASARLQYWSWVRRRPRLRSCS